MTIHQDDDNFTSIIEKQLDRLYNEWASEGVCAECAFGSLLSWTLINMLVNTDTDSFDQVKELIQVSWERGAALRASVEAGDFVAPHGTTLQ